MIAITILIDIILFRRIQSNLYLTMYVNFVDDCVNKIYVKENSTIEYFKFINDMKSTCVYNKYSYYPNFGKPIVKNNIYTLGNTIIIDIYNIHQGLIINMTVKINEYIINIDDNLFWDCDNECYFSNNQAYFKNEANDTYGNFSFKLNNFSDLNDTNSQINNTFYSLTSQLNFNHTINYKADELELINFNTSENFFVENDSDKLIVNYTNYKFKIIYMSGFNGSLIGLDSNHSERNLNLNSFFHINDTNGLKYKLSPEDKNKYSSNINLKIQAYNLFDKAVSEEQEFNFYIILEGDNLKCLKENYYNFSENIYYYMCPNLTEIKSNIAELLERIDANKSYVINGNNFTINISPLKSAFLILHYIIIPNVTKISNKIIIFQLQK